MIHAAVTMSSLGSVLCPATLPSIGRMSGKVTIVSASTDKTASVGQLVTAALITTVVSVVGSLLLARLSFQFVRKQELASELDNTMAAKSAELAQQLANKEQELEQTLRNEVAVELAKRRMDRQQRVRTVLAASAGPLLVAVEELLARLRNILEKEGYVQLRADWDAQRPRDWTATHDYFMSSTGYVSARYFAREAILRNSLGADEYETHDHPLMKALYDASRALSRWPAPFSEQCTGGDAQVFFWQQRALGEVVTAGDGERVDVLTYAAFLTEANTIAPHLAPLYALLRDISPTPEGTCRWQRLLAFLDALDTVRDQCRALLSAQDSRLMQETETTGGS
jgi:hypothetical protein